MAKSDDALGIRFAEYVGIGQERLVETEDGEDNTPPNRPCKLEGFSWCVSEDESKFFVFGGVDFKGDERNDLYAFQLNRGWEKLEAGEGSSAPAKRCGAAMAMGENKLFIFGGCSAEAEGWLNDLHSYDILTKKWEKIVAPADCVSPDGRDKSSMVFVPFRNQLFLYGGFGPKETPAISKPSGAGTTGGENSNDSDIQCVYSDVPQRASATFACRSDLHSFNIETGKWELVEGNAGKPPGLSAHSMCLVGDKLVIFGGKSETGERTNKAYAYDLEQNKWMSAVANEVEEEMPCGRSFHAAATLTSRLMLVIGGRDNDDYEMDDIYLLSIGPNKEMMWLEPMVNDNSEESQPPSGRYGHVTGVLKDPDSGKRKVVIYGGLAELDPETGVAETVLNDMTTAEVDEFVAFANSCIEDEEENNGTVPEEESRDSTANGATPTLTSSTNEGEEAPTEAKKAKLSSRVTETSAEEVPANGNAE